MKTRTLIPFMLIILALFACVNAVSAADIYVNTTGHIGGNGSSDNPFYSIQKGYDNITDGDTLIIADGTYTGTGNNQIVISHSITIKGQNQAGTIINGAGNSIFHISTGYNVIIQNLTLTASDTAIINGGTLTMNNCTLTGNTANNGGAIWNYGGICTLNDCTLTGNTANGHVGGAIWNYGGICTLNNCTLSGNSADEDGGAICNFYGSTLTVNNCTFNDNTAHNPYLGGGGAISNYGGTCTVTNCNFNGNRAGDLRGSGGAICNYNYGTLYVIGCTFTGNSASGSDYGNGGAIFNRDGYCSVINSTFTDNTANPTKMPGINFLNYFDMFAVGFYGGDICNGATLDVIGCIFNGNNALNIPGGIFSVSPVVMNINLNRILGNTIIVGLGGTVNWGLNWYSPVSLNVTKTGPTNVTAGNTITYTITVTNNGPGPADNVQIQDIIPAILQDVTHDSFNLGTIDEGSSKTVTITGTVPSSLVIAIIIENSATVTSSTPSIITPSNSVNTSVYIPKSDLYIQITRDNNNPMVGELFTLRYKLGNNGPDNATNVIVTVPLPEGLVISSISGDGNWAVNGNTITWTLKNVAVGDPDLYVSGWTTRSGNFIFSASIASDTLNINTQGVNSLSFNSVSQVNAATTTTGNTVGMQSTGVPIAGIILAILMVFGGFIGTRKQ